LPQTIYRRFLYSSLAVPCFGSGTVVDRDTCRQRGYPDGSLNLKKFSNDEEEEEHPMKTKTMATFVLVGMISAGTLFVGTASAKDSVNLNQASVNETSAFSAQPSTSNASFMTPQGVCLVTVTNNTPFTLKVFVNGEYRGFVYARHYLPVYVNSGYRTLSARADFVDGPSLFWNSGPLFYYSGGSYSWQLGI
jgi:hypothetical protein